MGQLPEAATALVQSRDEKCLKVASDIARTCGQITFANFISEQVDRIKAESQNTEEILAELPTRLELLMRESCDKNGEGDGDRNGEAILPNGKHSPDDSGDKNGGHLNQNGDGNKSN